MIIWVLVIGGGLLLATLIIMSRSEVVPWLDHMTRLNPGVVNRAEWMAPTNVVETVKRDYLAFYDYAAQTLPQGWVIFARDLNDYLSGEMLAFYRDSLNLRLQHNRGRSVGILRATHEVQVRHFSADGLRCVVVDYQTEGRMATYDYWTGVRLHTQDVGDGIYVYQMVYDQTARRWKLTRFIQTLPLGTSQQQPLDLDLPKPFGRDA